MNKLKTLKETHKEVWEKLKIAVSPLEKEFLRGRLIQIANDKEEAIKHIKALRKPKKKLSPTTNLDMMCTTVEWIKYYFNIEESDLK